MRLAINNQWQLLINNNGDAAIDQVKKLKNLGVFPALYPMYTFYWGDWHRDSVAGIKRAENISPTGWFLDEDMRFTIHSDAPGTFRNAMRILDSAVNRTTRSQTTLGSKHKITPLQALKTMTLWSAYQHFEENIKGSLEVGKQADMVILSDNPFTVSAGTIKDIKVLETINNGQSIFVRESD